MIQISFDNNSNNPDDIVLKNAKTAQSWGPKMNCIKGMRSKNAVRFAILIASNVCDSTFCKIDGNFNGKSLLNIEPMRPDYQSAALEKWGGVPVNKLPWLASEQAINKVYQADIKCVDINLILHINSPPVKVIVPVRMFLDNYLSFGETSLEIGVANVPMNLHLPNGMLPSDFGNAMDLISKKIHRAAVQLWIESSGGQQEVF